MKVYSIVCQFREEYEESGIAGIYKDRSKAEAALQEWEAENEDNCEEIRYIVENELL